MPVTVQAVLAARIDRLEPERQAAAAGRLGGRQGGRRPGAGADRRARATSEIDAALCELIEAGFLYEAELYPERVLAFRHPLTREVAYGTQLGEQRGATHAAAARAMIELEPDRLDELAALIAGHMEAGGETLEAARWSARAAHWAGHSRPRTRCGSGSEVTGLADELEESEETTALAVVSRLLQLDYAWRLGMDTARRKRAGRRGGGDRRPGPATCARWPC